MITSLSKFCPFFSNYLKEVDSAVITPAKDILKDKSWKKLQARAIVEKLNVRNFVLFDLRFACASFILMPIFWISSIKAYRVTNPSTQYYH